MLWKLLFLFIVVPLIELALLLWLAAYTDPLFALTVVIVTGVIGTFLARSQGWKTFRRIRLEMSQGRLPAEAMLDAAMIFCAGALLLTPGMLTDAFGMSLLIPYCRNRYRQRIFRWIGRNFKLQTFHAEERRDTESRIIDSYVVEPPANEDDKQP